MINKIGTYLSLTAIILMIACGVYAQENTLPSQVGMQKQASKENLSPSQNNVQGTQEGVRQKSVQNREKNAEANSTANLSYIYHVVFEDFMGEKTSKDAIAQTIRSDDSEFKANEQGIRSEMPNNKDINKKNNQNNKIVLDEQKLVLKNTILKLFKENSQLEFLKDKKPASLVALGRRASSDVSSAVEVMEAFGFYSSSASYTIDDKKTPYEVTLSLKTGPQYFVDNIEMEYRQVVTTPDTFMAKEKKVGFLRRKREKVYTFKFPKELPNIQQGQRAVAQTINDAVASSVVPFKQNGYPQAVIASSAFSVNKKKHTLKGKVIINQGFPALLGEVVVKGNKKVSATFIQNLAPWKVGDIWDERQLFRYRDALQSTGLFSSVNMRLDREAYREYRKKVRQNQKEKNSKPIEPVALPVLIDVTESTDRRVAGSLFYSTDLGPGVDINWEHRNFFGNAERLRVNVPFSTEERRLEVELRKPAFLLPNQTLIFRGDGGYEDTDAYEQEFIDFAVGLERVFNPQWRLESLLHIDKVNPLDNQDNYSGFFIREREENYYSTRLVSSLYYDNRNNVHEPVVGYKARFGFSPLYGYDTRSFYSLGLEIDSSFYFKLSEKFVLATRVALGSMLGSEFDRIPRTKRFFLGGGGTVRGFSYQELGRHDLEDEALGGLSYTFFNLEGRIAITPELSIVPFLDGGMVYEESTPQWGQDFAFGAGIGARYVTPVGPVRFDIAFPLTGPNRNSTKSLSDFQIYMSIGQAF